MLQQINVVIAHNVLPTLHFKHFFVKRKNHPTALNRSETIKYICKYSFIPLTFLHSAHQLDVWRSHNVFTENRLMSRQLLSASARRKKLNVHFIYLLRPRVHPDLN